MYKSQVRNEIKKNNHENIKGVTKDRDKTSLTKGSQQNRVEIRPSTVEHGTPHITNHLCNGPSPMAMGISDWQERKLSCFAVRLRLLRVVLAPWEEGKFGNGGKDEIASVREDKITNLQKEKEKEKEN